MGRPKAWLPFAGETMLARIVRLLGEAVSPIIVVAALEQDLPALPPEVTVVRDEERGRGPLQGLAAGLTELQGRVDAAYASSCDVPFLRPAFVTRMIELLGSDQICVPRVGAYHHPLAAVYRVEVLNAVAKLLNEDRLRPVFLFDAVPTRVVEAHELRHRSEVRESAQSEHARGICASLARCGKRRLAVVKWEEELSGKRLDCSLGGFARDSRAIPPSELPPRLSRTLLRLGPFAHSANYSTFRACSCYSLQSAYSAFR